jgi:hypothetical protein
MAWFGHREGPHWCLCGRVVSTIETCVDQEGSDLISGLIHRRIHNWEVVEISTGEAQLEEGGHWMAGAGGGCSWGPVLSPDRSSASLC